MCGTGIRGRSGFTRHTEQLTASLPLVSSEVLHTEPLCPPPKHTLLSQRAGSSVSPPSHCPLFPFPSFFISGSKQIPSSCCLLSVSIRYFSPPLLSRFLVTQSIFKQSLTPPHETVRLRQSSENGTAAQKNKNKKKH